MYKAQALLILLSIQAISCALGFQIGPLLSTCVDACQKGCIEIRKVQASREQGRDNVDASVVFKDVNDPRSALTAADNLSQKMIVGSLRSHWGKHLRIVGEEDGDEELAKEISRMIGENAFAKLDTTLFDDDLVETADIDPSEITIYVDPLDGTREFVEGRLENCQVLIGVAIGGEAVAGAIGIPFPSGNLTDDETIVYGLADFGTGVRGTLLRRGPYPLEKHIDGIKYPRPHHATGDSSAAVMEASRKAAIKRFGGSNVIYGGAGNKILAAALGEVTCSIQHMVGGPWDLCAPEAILKGMGGRMTDLFGNEIDIYRNDHPRCNERGYIASPPGAESMFHEALVSALSSCPEVQEYKKNVMGE
jgi:3'-phosphoadenosine 5'-phosphosulfate (PAPS) 3'-phosphatase